MKEWISGVRDHRDHFQSLSGSWTALLPRHCKDLELPPLTHPNPSGIVLMFFLWNCCIKRSVIQWGDEHQPHFRKLEKKCLELKLSGFSINKSQTESKTESITIHVPYIILCNKDSGVSWSLMVMGTMKASLGLHLKQQVSTKFFLL